jgi:hypothetical protein
MGALPVSDERADAHKGVVDVLRELVAEALTNVWIPLADMVVGGGEPAEVGTVSRSHTMTLGFIK